jgi:catechol 2,3-dioxygenase-like lactoylglutathione lyase family enzyme
MRLEHIALQVAEPAAMADWYATHLGFSIRRRRDQPVVVRFLADGSGSVLLELYRNAAAPLPDYRRMDPAVLHLAVLSADLPADVARLVAAGAALVRGPEVLGGDDFAMLRDPWGMPLQLVRRAQPMIE